VRLKARGISRKIREYLKEKINELETNSRNKNITTSVIELRNSRGATDLEVTS
jgi:hypothetical protein